MNIITLDPSTLATYNLVADADLVTGTGTDNSAALLAFFDSINGTSSNFTRVVVPDGVKIAAQTIRLPQTPWLELVSANSRNCGFVRPVWNGASDREAWITNRPNSTTYTATSARHAAHVVIDGGVWNANGQIDQHSNATTGWNAGMLFVGLAFDSTSVFKNYNFRYAKTFAHWFLNCSGINIANISILGNGILNNDGLHFNSCDNITVDGYTATNTGDDAIALNVESLANDWASIGGQDATVAPLFYAPPWMTGYTGAPITNVAISNVRISNCFSGIRLLSLRGIALSNIVIRNVTVTETNQPIIASPFGANPGVSTYSNIEISSLTATVTAGMASIGNFVGAFTGTTKLNRWRRVSNPAITNPTHAGAGAIAFATGSTIANLETKDYTAILSNAEASVAGHITMAGNVTQTWQATGATVIRQNAAQALADTVYLLNTSINGLMTVDANHAEGIGAILLTQGDNNADSYIGGLSIGSGNTFVAPACLRAFVVDAVSAISGTGNIAQVGTEASAKLFDDPFDGTTFSGAWLGNPGGAPSGGAFTPNDNMRMWCDAGASGAAAILQVTGNVASGAASYASVQMLAGAAAGDGTGGLYPSVDVGSNPSVSMGALALSASSAGGPFVQNQFPRGTLRQGTPFTTTFLMGRGTALVSAQDTVDPRRGCTGLWASADLLSSPLSATGFGFATSSGNGGVTVLSATAYRNQITNHSVVKATSVSGATSVQPGSGPIQYTAAINGSGLGSAYQKGVWSVFGPGAIDPVTGVYTPPADTSQGNIVKVRFTPYLSDLAYGELAVTLVVSGGGSIDYDAVQARVVAGMLAQGYTPARATKLDNADVATSSRSNHSAADAGQAAKTAILSNGYALATNSSGQVQASSLSGYVAPNNAGIVTLITNVASILAAVQGLPSLQQIVDGVKHINIFQRLSAKLGLGGSSRAKQGNVTTDTSKREDGGTTTFAGNETTGATTVTDTPGTGSNWQP